jgi:hypothetical protein
MIMSLHFVIIHCLDILHDLENKSGRHPGYMSLGLNKGLSSFLQHTPCSIIRYARCHLPLEMQLAALTLSKAGKTTPSSMR